MVTLNNLSREHKSSHLLKLDQTVAKTQRIIDEAGLTTVEVLADISCNTFGVWTPKEGRMAAEK